MFVRKTFGILLSCLLFTVSVFADDRSEATATIRAITTSLLSQLNDRDLYEKDKKEFYRILEEEVISGIEMTLMSKLILRQHWVSAPEEQRMRFLTGFKNMLLESYGKVILLLPDIEIKFITPPGDSPVRKYQIVHTQIISNTSEPPLSVDYYLIKRDKWKIFDFVIDGVSIVKQFRQSFGEEVETTGFNSLINRLNKDFGMEVGVRS